MKTILKLAIIFISVFANASNIDMNKKYMNELINYKIDLPNEIYNPFRIKQPKKKQIKKQIKTIKNIIQRPQYLEKRVSLLAVLNNKALLKIEGMNIKKWLKKGEKIERYQLQKIINNNSVLVLHNHKTKIITIKNSNINIKVEK